MKGCQPPFWLFFQMQYLADIFFIAQKILFDQSPALFCVQIGSEKCRQKADTAAMVFLDGLQNAVGIPPLESKALQFGRVIDAAVAANCCDGTLFVIGDSKLKSRQAQEVVAQLQKGGSRILGVVINKLQTKGKAYYYARKGRYKYSYSGKYGANK